MSAFIVVRCLCPEWVRVTRINSGMWKSREKSMSEDIYIYREREKYIYKKKK